MSLYSMVTGTRCRSCSNTQALAALHIPRCSAARLARPLRVLLAGLMLMLAVPALAQEGGGLKLGDEAENTLDLGPARTGEPADEGGTGNSESDAPAENQAGKSRSETPPEITKHGDWEVACAPGGKNCFMTQEGRDKDGKTALRIMIEPLPEPQEVEDQTVIAVIDIVTPLGVVLNTGLAFTVDDEPTSLAPFQICTVEGCLVREPVTEDVINSLKRGRTTNIRFVVANYGEVSSDVSLSGFTAAYNSL